MSFRAYLMEPRQVGEGGGSAHIICIQNKLASKHIHTYESYNSAQESTTRQGQTKYRILFILFIYDAVYVACVTEDKNIIFYSALITLALKACRCVELCLLL